MTLSARSSRRRQFDFARRALIEFVANPPVAGLDGLLTQGLFVFTDRAGNFRLSLVIGKSSGAKIEWSSFKRQSHFVKVNASGKTFRQRLGRAFDWRTLDGIKASFNIDALTKDFYGRLFNWFEAAKANPRIEYPNRLATDDDNRDALPEHLIRLITRLMFVWFLKEKGLVPSALFDEDHLKTILNGGGKGAAFDPKAADQFVYYNAILQNLFFATLNAPIEKRALVKHGIAHAKNFGVKQLYRYAALFKHGGEDAETFILRLFERVPYLNGGLFMCLDELEKNVDGKKVQDYFDGFAEHLRTRDGKLKRAQIPNAVFFGDGQDGRPDGLINILKDYNFTVDENSPGDEDVALDPEMLGKVFENLLAAVNSETAEQARKATGSFYTPREIVNYMVDESLKAYLKGKIFPADLADNADEDFQKKKRDKREKEEGREELTGNVSFQLAEKGIATSLSAQVGKPAIPVKSLSAQVGKPAIPVKSAESAQSAGNLIDALFTEEAPEEARATVEAIASAGLREAIITALKTVKVLDPACGSGAFPIGMLVRIVAILEKLGDVDPDDPRSVYAAKNTLMQQCIYGGDIQLMAAQISKLRFFISLVCDEKPNDDKNDNYGILPLPNLETKFVACNSLIGLSEEVRDAHALADPTIREKIDTVMRIRTDYFNAHGSDQKLRIRDRDRAARAALQEAIVARVGKPDADKIAFHEQTIARLQAELVKYQGVRMVKRQVAKQSAFDFVDPAPEQAALDFESYDANAEKRGEIENQILAARREIENEREKPRKHRDTIKRDGEMMAKWDPYDPHSVAAFFDPEWMFGIKDGFDIVIGNPPYCQTYKGIYSKIQFPFSEGKDTGKQNLYKVFIEHGFNLVKQGGHNCQIVQSSLLGDVSAKFTRELLLKSTSIQKILEFPKNAPTAEGKVFKSVLQGTCIFLFAKKVPTENHRFDLSVNNDRTTISPPRFESIRQSFIIPSFAGYEIPLLRVGESALLEKIRATASGKVKDFIIDDAQGNINTIYLREIEDSKNTGAWIAKGAHVHRWSLSKDLYFAKDNQRTQELFAKNLNRNLIITQNISGTTDKYRINALPLECRNTRIVFLHSANILYLPSPEKMKFVCALLNCKITDWIFRKTSTNNHLNMYELEAIPVPPHSNKDEEKLIELVDKILAAKKVNAEADTSAWEREIDNLVYGLYGLTPEEVAIVEGKSPADLADNADSGDGGRDVARNVSTVGRALGIPAPGGRGLPETRLIASLPTQPKSAKSAGDETPQTPKSKRERALKKLEDLGEFEGLD